MQLQVLVVDDDPFTRRLLRSVLASQGHQVRACASASEAIALMDEMEPHCLICDLDLGSAVSGIDLLTLVHDQRPWIGLIALTAHRDPALVGAGALPEVVRYLVKSEVEDLEILGAIVAGITSPESPGPCRPPDPLAQVATLSRSQAEVLRLVASGLSNEAIAEERGVSVRAVEYMLHRIYAALGLAHDDRRNPRVDAVAAWRQGRVSIK